MSRRQSVDWHSAHQLIQLANELHELPGLPEQRAEHLLNRLCPLFEARVSYFAICRAAANGVTILSHASGGWIDEDVRRYFRNYSREEHVQDPLVERLLTKPEQPKIFVRREVVQDRMWYGSDHYNEVSRLMGIDDRMYVALPFDEQGGIVGIGLHRARGHKAFGLRERRAAALLGPTLRSLARQSVYGSAPPLPPLPLRLRETLEQLLAGGTEKDIARRLGISHHTVHGYVKKLYARLGVKSRPELMATLTRPPK